MKRSAGILVYKKENGMIKVLLAHPGGPFWKDKKSHSWSIPKGEKEDKEKAADTAKREFKEETNLEVEDNLKYLGSKKVVNNKLIIMFYLEKDYDLSNCKSNTFKRMYNGKMQEFKEMDDYRYFEIEKAKEKIFKNQIYFIEKLEKIIK